MGLLLLMTMLGIRYLTKSQLTQVCTYRLIHTCFIQASLFRLEKDLKNQHETHR